tara:strand:+ start:355 stop:1065 length:711 start_codon:yes stop_codon:yes gene_type:complete
MNEKDFHIFFNLSSTKLSIAVFKKFDDSLIFFKEYNCQTDINKSELNFDNIERIIKKSIFEIEKITNSFLNDLYLMIETTKSISIDLSLAKNNDLKKIQRKDVQYLIQDAKQQILRAHYDKDIAHIIVSNYIINNIKYDYLPINVNCEKFSIDIKFICFSKNLIKKLEKLFNNNQIYINKIICSNYAKSIDKNQSNTNICEFGLKLIHGINKQEVVIIPRKLEKKGFFERLFHLFK